LCSVDLSKAPAHASRFAAMTKALDAWVASIVVSAATVRGNDMPRAGLVG
jgi:hypothetical protein